MKEGNKMAYIKKFDGNTEKTYVLGSDGNPTSIEGYYFGKKETPDTNGYGPGVLHFFKTNEGMIGVWGKPRLNKLLDTSDIGKMMLVEFTGMIPNGKGRKPSYGYEASVDPTNTTDVSGVSIGSSTGNAGGGDDYAEDAYDETVVDEDSEEAPPVRVATATAKVAAPDAARQAKLQALVRNRKAG